MNKINKAVTILTEKHGYEKDAANFCIVDALDENGFDDIGQINCTSDELANAYLEYSKGLQQIKANFRKKVAG